MHLLRVTPPPENIRHLHNSPIEIVGKVKHLNPYEMHEVSDMVGIEPGVSHLTGEILHDNQHQVCIRVFGV